MEKQPDKNNPWKKLPQFMAPDQLWEKIEKDLDEPEKTVPLSEGIKQMESFRAPDSVWVAIEKKLELTQSRGGRPIYSMWWSIAAGILLVVGFFGWYFSQNIQGDGVQYAQWEEVIDEDWQVKPEREEDAFLLVAEFCQQKQYVCNTPEFQNLKAELDELNLACEALKEAIGQYNDEPAMIAQLTDIEMERTRVLKKIITYL